MKIKISKAILFAVFALLGCAAYAGAPMRAADMASEVAPDPKKKKAGEECKTSDECQRHHSCTKNGEKNLCTAPPRSKIPPGAVT